jgi:transglutaminase-like putative cysteine protease
MSAAEVRLSGSLRRSVGWTVVGAVLAYAVADVSAEFLILISAGVAAAWIFAVGPGRPAPARAINSGLLGVLGIGSLQLLRLGFTVNAFAYFIGLLLVVKLFDLRRSKDWGQALVLVTGLYISAVLTSNSMLTGAMLLFGTLLHFRAILRYQLYSAAERGGRAGSPVDAGMRRDLRSLQIGGGFAILLAAATVFVFLPRNLGSQSFGNWGSLPSGQTTGFTDEVQLGGPGLISQSQTPVMDITVTDRNDRNRGRADAAAFYLRGAVLESYSDGRWTREDNPALRRFIRSQYIPDEAIIRPWLSPNREQWEIELRVTIRSVTAGTSPLFTVWQPLELRPVGNGQFIAHDPVNGVVMREGSAARVEYVTRSRDPRFTPVLYPQDGVRSPLSPGEIPEGVRAFAEGVLADLDIEPDPASRPLGDDIRAVRALENHLQSAFSYTLIDEPVPPGREPTVWFLTERRRGHCEYYASALALMARSIGINARVITGYVASDFNEVTGQYVVRESNAHGWVEAEVAPDVWMTFDGTPPSDFYQIHQPSPSFWRSVKKLYETAEFAWATGVVAFDTESQRRLLGELATDFGLRRFGGRMIERLRTDGVGLLVRAAIVAVSVFCASMVIGLVLMHRRGFFVAVWAGLNNWLRGVRARFRGTPPDPAARLHAVTLRALSSSGQPKPDGVPLRTHLERVSPALTDELAGALSGSCELLYRARFTRAAPPAASEFARAGDAIRASENRERSAASR